MDPDPASLLTVRPAGAVEDLPWEPLGAIAGVRNKVLWHDANSMAGLLRVEAGQHLGAHTHHANHHHMWLLEGHARIVGADLGPGAYVHIPAGVEHDIDASRSEGCTLFYLYILPAGAASGQ